MSTLLPPAARAALVAASKVESRIEAGESKARIAAVDAAVAQARSNNPELFQEVK
ncbi:MAG: hypothetical protein Q8R92_17205 [Deltaproteobacteria bacterium]|nr:hypothetical protein [Deltaproteobacteria bacterium]